MSEEAEPGYVRTWDEIQAGGLWPPQGIMPDPEASRRHLAIYEVLRRIPQEAYERLCTGADEWLWFIPDEAVLGMVMPFYLTSEGLDIGGMRTGPLSIVLYLDPLLERAGWNILVAVIAHELAHLFLGHSLFTGDEYETQENEAWSVVLRWGFSREAMYHAARGKRLKTLEDKLIKRLEREMEEGIDNGRNRLWH